MKSKSEGHAKDGSSAESADKSKNIPDHTKSTSSSGGSTGKPSSPVKSIKALLMSGSQKSPRPGPGRPPKGFGSPRPGQKGKLLKTAKPGQILIKRPRGRPPKNAKPVLSTASLPPAGVKKIPKVPKGERGRPRKNTKPVVSTTATVNPYSTITQALNRKPQGQTLLQKSLGILPSVTQKPPPGHPPVTKPIVTSSADKPPVINSISSVVTAPSHSDSPTPSMNGDVNKNIIAPKANVSELSGSDTSKDSSTLGNSAAEEVGTIVPEPQIPIHTEPAMEVRAFWKPPAETKPLLDQVSITDVTTGSLTITIRESASEVGFFRSREGAE